MLKIIVSVFTVIAFTMLRFLILSFIIKKICHENISLSKANFLILANNIQGFIFLFLTFLIVYFISIISNSIFLSVFPILTTLFFNKDSFYLFKELKRTIEINDNEYTYREKTLLGFNKKGDKVDLYINNKKITLELY